MAIEFTATARRLGIHSAIVVSTLLVAYAVTLAVGLASLSSPDEPIGNPAFSILEVLIIAMTPAMVTLMVAIHAWAPAPAKALSLTALVFMSLVAGVTCSVHVVILTVSQHAAFAQVATLSRLLSFEWPSVVYALDILAWDFFFALSMLFAAPVFRDDGVARWIRPMMIISGALALAGLSGAATGDMRLRNIGILGYVPVFFVVTVLLTVLFARSSPR
jgi:hypothetical protein